MKIYSQHHFVQVHNKLYIAVFHFWYVSLPLSRFLCLYRSRVHIFYLHVIFGVRFSSHCISVMCKYQCSWIWIQLPNGDGIFTIFDGNFWWLKWKCTTLLADWVAGLAAISITCNDVTKMHLHTNFKFCNEFWCDCAHHCIHSGYLYQTIECNFVCLILVKSMPHTPKLHIVWYALKRPQITNGNQYCNEHF